MNEIKSMDGIEKMNSVEKENEKEFADLKNCQLSFKNSLMDLKNYSDQKLVFETKALVKSEKEILTNILRHLVENERRKLYCDYKYSSIYEFCMKELGYTEKPAYKRVAAMRLLMSLSESDSKKIQSLLDAGKLDLTHLCLAQTYFRKEEKLQQKKLSASEKMRVFEDLSGSTTRAAQKKLSPPDEEFSTIAELKITDARKEKMELFKALVSNKYPYLDLEEMFDLLLEMGIQTLEEKSPMAKTVKREMQEQREKQEQVVESAAKDDSTSEKFSAQRKSLNPRFIAAETRRRVWLRDDGQCTNCGSRHSVEIDHIQPVAFGGGGELENLRLLCRPCNGRMAFKNLSSNFHY